MKHVFKRRRVRTRLPDVIAERKDKMGFPVPLHGWLREPGLREIRPRRALVERGAGAAR